MSAPRAIPILEAAQRLGVSPKRVRRWLRDGLFPNATPTGREPTDADLIPEPDVERIAQRPPRSTRAELHRLAEELHELRLELHALRTDLGTRRPFERALVPTALPLPDASRALSLLTELTDLLPAESRVSPAANRARNEGRS